MNLREILKVSEGLPPPDLKTLLFARKICGDNSMNVATAQGYPCILPKSVGKYAVDYTIYGNTVQNGTPSPDSPVEVQSVGELVTEGEYAGKYKIPVVTRGKNLFSGFVRGIGINSTTGEELPRSVAAATDYIKVVGGVDYILSGLANDLYSFVAFYDENKNYLNRSPAGATDSRHLTINANARYIRITQYENTGVTGTIDDIDSVTPQLELGSTATSYEPYKEPVTTNIYLDEPLRKIGDYADVLNFKNQSVSRKIKKIVFDGTERWIVSNSNNDVWQRYPIGINLSDSIYNPKPIFCDRYIYKNSSESAPGDSSARQGASHNFWFFINFDELTGEKTTDKTEILNAWKQKLSENPVTVWYVLENDETESVNIPQIPTFKETTVITTDTEVPPSNIEITYKSRR